MVRDVVQRSGKLSTIPFRHRKVDNFAPESLDNFDRNEWTTSNGIGGQLAPEYAALSTYDIVTVFLRGNSRFSLSRDEGIASIGDRSVVLFTPSRVKSGCVVSLLATGRAFMTSDTGWLSGPWCSGTGQVKMSNDGCPCSQPISVMPTSAIPTGISPLAPN
jgi:hypothetical protein